MKLALWFAPAILAAGLALQDDGVREAMKNLGSDNYETREKAAAELRKIGAPALEALRRAAKDDADPEVRLRARQLADEIEKAAPPKPAPRRAAGGGSLSVKIVNGDASYALTPASGDPITFHKRADGSVRLEYVDESGRSAAAEGATLDKFLGEHADLARKFGISAEGIDYGGMKTSFQPRVRFQAPPRWPDQEPGQEPFGDLQEELRKMMEELRRNAPELPPAWEPEGLFGFPVVRGARLGPVPDVLRTQLSIPEGQGVVVEAVREGTTADSVGLKKHDVILEIDGRKTGSVREVRERLTQEAAVKILRGGKEQTVKATRKEY